jgi:hypothetical protein
MTALTSPYRLADTPLMTRERALERELASAREMLDAYSNEEVRIERKALLGEATRAELASITSTIEALIVTVDRLSCELSSVRREIVWRGERKEISPSHVDDGPLWPLWIGAVFFLLVVAGGVLLPLLRSIDTARAAPKDATFAWGGPLEPDQAWLYVEGRNGAGFEIGGRFFRTPNRVPVSALHSHDVTFEGGGNVVVRWIPCTTAVVRSGAGERRPTVERFYNSSTCF